MELRHLRYFVAVGEEQHYGRASRRLRVAQPALSRQIQDLEEEVGFKLFERLPRGVKLSAAGKLFLEDARRILQEVSEATAHARLAWLAVIQGRCASASPRMRHGAALFRIPSGAFGSSNPTRNCNFILRRVWSSWKP